MSDSTPKPPRRRLSDILAGNTDDIRKQFDQAQAAGEFGPLPGGMYIAHVDRLELFNARTTTTPGVKLSFRICEGEHVERLIFHDLWLTAAALPQTKRDLAKLEITRLEQLESIVIPRGRIRCSVRLALRREDDGLQHNRVRGFDVIGLDEPPTDPFAPSDNDGDNGGPGTGKAGSADPPGDADGDTSFNPVQLDAANSAKAADAQSPTSNADGSLFDGGGRPTAWAEQ